MSAVLAFLHHLAAFALVAALAVELVLLRLPLTPLTARKLLSADQVYGAAAGLVLAIGLLRVFLFEKGAAYYFHNALFIAKLALFASVGLMSIYPTVAFMAWRKPLAQGEAPLPEEAKVRRIRAIVHAELALVALVIVCAALMARGVGSLG